MKEAIGGTWIFGLVIFFIAFFTAFISISLNYSKCYKLKDEMIAAIQRASGVNQDSLKEINDYMSSIGYRSSGNCNDDVSHSICMYGFNISVSGEEITGSYNNDNANYCIQKKVVTAIPEHPQAAYYYVKVFFRFDLPVIREVFGLKVDGETFTIHSPHDSNFMLSCTGEEESTEVGA